MDIEKFTERSRGFLQAAQTIAIREFHQQLTPEHLLKALLGDADTDHAGRIDIYKLAKYTQRNVEQASAGQLRVQTPSYYFAGNDFFELRALAATP